MADKNEFRNVCIGQDRIAGLSQTKIAKKHNISQMQVSRILKKEEIQDIINKGTSEMIAMVPKAVEVIKACLDNSDEDPKLAYESAKTTLKTTGIIPSHTSINIDKLLIDNRQQQDNDRDRETMRAFMRWRNRKGAPDYDAQLEDPTDEVENS